MSIIEASESESLADSEDSFSLAFQYTLASGVSIPLNLNLYGQDYQMGCKVRNDGCIEVSAEDSHLWRSLKRIINETWIGRDQNLKVPEYVKTVTSEKVNKDTELLFLEACGFTLNESSELYGWEIKESTHIEHAAVYYESGWLTPLNCQMVYHQDPREFAKDFERIYADYHWGITMPLLYALEKDIWQLSPLEIASLNSYKGFTRRCGKEYPGNYKTFSQALSFVPATTEYDSINFVESLDREKIQKLVKLPLSHIKEVFSAVAESELPEVRYRDFGDCGVVLLTGADLSIWRAYQWLVELSSDYLE